MKPKLEVSSMEERKKRRRNKNTPPKKIQIKWKKEMQIKIRKKKDQKKGIEHGMQRNFAV